MHILSRAALHVLQHSLAFVWQVLQGLGRNLRLLLTGVVACYALLSMVQMLTLCRHSAFPVRAPAELLDALGFYLDWLVPSQSQSLLVEESGFLVKGTEVGPMVLVTMLFFSSLAFSQWKNR